MKLDLNRVISRVSKNVGLIHASLMDSVEITPQIHRVVVAFNTNDATPTQRYMAIANLFENNAAPIENSFREIASGYKYTTVGFISTNTESLPYTEEVAASGKYTAVAGTCNVMIDQSDESLWEVTSSGDNKYLVRKSQENLSDLVSLASLKNEVANYKTIPVDQIVSQTFKGEYVSYVDPVTCSIKYGYVVADAEDFVGEDEAPEVEVLDSESLDTVQLNPELIVESVFMDGDDCDNLPQTETASSYDSSNNESLKAYYKQMFSYAPEYYKKLEMLINQHSAV
jgi:hypothetical protein